MHPLLQDLRSALRSLVRRPGFSATIVLTLAFAIGANAAVYTVVSAMTLRPLPHVDDENLVAIAMRHAVLDVVAYDFRIPDYLHLAESCRSCAGVGAFDGRSLVLTNGDEPERVIGAAVSPGLFSLLGVPPLEGREFLDAEGVPGSDAVVILSHDLWQRRLGGDPTILGSTLSIDGADRVVVGVMPPGFRFPSVAEAWIPLALSAEDRESRAQWLDHLVARLQPDVTLATARAEARAVGETLAREHPDTNRGWTFELLPWREALVDDGTRHVLALLLGAVAFVLLIACANIANLLLVRESERRHELAVQLALGSGRGPLLRRLLIESLVLAAAGAGAGLLIASWVVDLVSATNPEGFDYWLDLSVDGRVAAFAAGLAVLATLLFGTLPALRALPRDLASELKAGRRGSPTPARQRLQRLLVVAETALAVMLLFGAFLLVESLTALDRLDPGFDTDRLLVLRTQLAGEAYGTGEARGAFAERSARIFSELPGVVSAAATGAVPLDEDGITATLLPAGADPERDNLPVTVIGSSASLFTTLGVELLQGRTFTPTEALDPESEPVAVVGRRLAERLWAGDAIGQIVRFTSSPRPEVEVRVIGVVPDLYYEEPGEETDQSSFQVHLPYHRAARWGMKLLVRTEGPPEEVAPRLRRELQRLDATLPVAALEPLESVRHVHLWAERLQSGLLGAFAVVALVLAVLGVYGVMAFAVGQRRLELGVRMALGATGRSIRRLLLGEGLAIATVGLGLGLVGAFLLSGWLRSTLYGIEAGGLGALVAGAAVLLGAALLACWLPAQRASRTDPVSALRCE